jgi:membrane-associated phospholipid phosphatase
MCAALCANAWGEGSAEPETAAPQSTVPNRIGIIPFRAVFHDIGWNVLHSFTHNYGLNFVGAGLYTYAFIASGLDWRWNRLAYNHNTLVVGGMPALYIEYGAPFVVPAVFYLTGRHTGNTRLQASGLAITQAIVLTFGVQSILKVSTGRAAPGIVTELDQKRGGRNDDFSGKFNWFNMNFVAGWPSGHTATAFAAAAAISQIYPDIHVKIAAFSYAALIGLGVSFSVHWASDVIAGALIGSAIGATVGKSFNRLLEGGEKPRKVSFFAAYNTMRILIHV